MVSSLSSGLKKTKVSVFPSLEQEEMLTVKVSNPSVTVAFFTQLKLQDEKGRSVRPAFYSDNFFNLLPGESKTVTIEFSKEDIVTSKYNLVIDGWNIVPETIPYRRLQ